LPVKAIILDFNGVIICDRDLMYRSTCHVFEAYKVKPPTMDQWRACAGSNYMKDMYEKLGLRNITSQDQHRIRNKYIFEHWGDASIRPYCYEVLSVIRRLGVQTSIVSAEASVVLYRRIREAGIGHLFDKVFSEASPKKEFLVQAVDLFGLQASEILFLEDSAEGIRIGNELGLMTVAFMNETSYSFHREMAAENPKFRITELTELIGLINLDKNRIEKEV